MNWMPREAVRIEQPSLREHQEKIAFGIISTLWRRRWIIVGLAVISFVVALLVLLISDREYQSDAVVRLDFNAIQSVGLPQQAPRASIDASALVESEARTIHSHAMAQRVVKLLNLESDPAFTPHTGPIKLLLNAVGLGMSAEPASLLDTIASHLLSDLTVSNDSRSYLITVSYTSKNREQAALIANTFANEYLRSKIEADDESAEQTRKWLASQIEEKRASLAMLERAYLAEMNQIDIKAREARRASLEGQISSVRERLRSLTENIDSIRSLIALKPTSARLVSQAQPARLPISPKPLIVLGSALGLGLGAGIALAVLLERRDTGLRSDLEVLATTGIPCLGAVPEIKKSSSVAERFSFSAAVQEVAASAGLNNLSASSKVALIASAVPLEGKSFFIEALSRQFATSGRRVLTIDASPRAYRDDVAIAAHLETLLTDAAARDSFFSDQKNEITGLVYRTSGLVDGQNIFFGHAFKEFIQQARGYYDLILIECPPLLLTTEPWLTDISADALILVSRWNKTPRAAIKAALQRLTQRSAYVTGIALTRVVLNQHKDYFLLDQAYFLRKYMQYYKESA